MHGLRWARFERYEIRDRDSYIRPSGAVTFYDPWDDFGAPEGKTALEQPYHAFLTLARRLPLSVAALTADDAAAICAWCNDHGLPGVLQECVTSTVIAENSPAGPRLTAIARETGGWAARPVRRDSTALRAELVHIDRAPHGIVDACSYAIARPLDGFGSDAEPLSRTWTRFFPDFRVPCPDGELPPYPVPFTDWFWQSYAEQLNDFLNAARIFRGAVDGSAQFQTRKPRTESERQAAFAAEQLLWRLTSSVHPILHLQRGRGTNYAVGWVSDSLLSAYAMMAALDLSRSRQLECETCHSLFISQARQARYCSTTCRKTAQMRAYRSKQAKQRSTKRAKKGRSKK